MSKLAEAFDKIELDGILLEAQGINKLFDYIVNVPEHPSITRISSNAYSINFSDLSKDKILSATYYDNKYLSKLLQKEFQKADDWENLASKVDTIIAKGYLLVDSVGRIKFNDNFREYLSDYEET